MRKTNKTMPVQRNAFAESLRNFRASSFHHKCEARGGASNDFGNLLDEVAEDREIELELAQITEGQ